MDYNLKRGLLAAYKKLLTPLVRILIRNGVSFEEFGVLAKRVFVEVAFGELEAIGEIDIAQAEILAGVSHQEAVRLRRQGDPGYELGGNLARVTRILSAWHTDTRFTGPYGLPLELPLESRTQKDFRELAAYYCPELEPETLLRELQSIGAVKETDANWFKVITRTYLPDTGDLDSVERLGDVIGNFVETIDHNRREQDPERRLFERIAVADNGVRPEDLPLFRDYVRARAQLFLEEVDNWLSQLDPPSSNSDTEAAQMTGVGIYHYVERENKEGGKVN